MYDNFFIIAITYRITTYFLEEFLNLEELRTMR